MKRSAGPFEILEVLGEGSFGTVCVARVSQDPLKRKVALKILKGAYIQNKKILNRTRDEARLLARINHQNIVRVERLMEVNGRPVVVMEYVEGVSLDQLLMRFKDGLPAAVAIEVTRLMCIALHVAYGEALGEDGRPLRVIHRDIKPSNVLMSTNGELKVGDFGIAKAEFEGREAQTESVVMGSRPYMAPERLDGMNDSPSVDVYSAGMSMFELLTGRTMSLSINPVAHDQAMGRQLQIVQVRGMNQAALEDLRNLIRRMCAYPRDYRPTALECAKELELLLFAIEPRYRIGLEEFARTTVVPIFETRPRIKPDDAIDEGTDDDSFRDITEAFGTKTSPKEAPVAPSPPSQPSGNTRGRAAVPIASVVFMLGVLVVVAVLATLAVVKVVQSQAVANVPPVPVPASPSGQVKIHVWIPSDASAEVGGVVMPGAGYAIVPAGPSEVKILFQDGRSLRCSFEAWEGERVTFVRDAGRDAISVDDGRALPCVEVTAASAG